MAPIKSAIAVWDFTLKEEGVDLIAFKDFIKEHAKKWAFQLEKSDSGYVHYQGRVSLKVKCRVGPDWKNIRWSVTHCHKDQFYVIKVDTRIAGPWQDTDKYIPRQVRDIKLYPWQEQILDDAKVWNTRTINLLYCPEGNIGKSTLATYAGSMGLARAIPMMDGHKDYMRMVMDMPKMKLYLVDFPRSMTKAGCASFWSAIEQVKNGYAYDDRYGFKEEYFDCPNIWVFTNVLPDEGVLSMDRWKIWMVAKPLMILQRWTKPPVL